MRRLAVLTAAAAFVGSCGPVSPRADRIAKLHGSFERGETLFARHCRDCHRNGGLMNTAQWYPKRAFLTVIVDGMPGGQMPASAQLGDQDIADLYAYIERADR